MKRNFYSMFSMWNHAGDAENIEVTTFKYAGPYALVQPYQVDSVDVNSKSWKAESLLDTPVSFFCLKEQK